MRPIRYSFLALTVLVGLTMTTGLCAQPREPGIFPASDSAYAWLTGSGIECEKITDRSCPLQISSEPVRTRPVTSYYDPAPRQAGLLPQVRTDLIGIQRQTTIGQYESRRGETPQHWNLLPTVSHDHCDLQHYADPVHRLTCQITPKLDYAKLRDATSDRYVIGPQIVMPPSRPQRDYVTRDRYVISPQQVQASRPRRDHVMRYDRYGGRAQRVAKLGGKLAQPRRSSAPVKFKRNPAGNRRLASRVNDRKQNHVNLPPSSYHKPISKKPVQAFRSRRLLINDTKRAKTSRKADVKFNRLVQAKED